MSNDLRRVGLVFKEDGAVDFKKSLQEINLELNKNYNQFKLTQAQWDKSTKSTQKLRAEQEYLKNAYEIQQDKVNTLKMQLSDLENAENKNTTAIKKKRNELTNAEIKLENYKNKIQDIEYQLNNTGKKIEEFGAKTEKVGNKIEGAGKKLSAFSVAVGSAFVASAKNAIDFEEAFTGVEKTVDGTEQQMAELKQGIRDMAKEIPSSTTEISAVAEAAGQLGIKTDDVLSFTRTMIDMGNATNLSADEAATTLARFANVTKMSQKDFGRLGSVIVALGNNFATTEAEISAMGMNLASAGTQVGMSQSQIMALATALSSVGLEAQAGGTAFSKVMVNMQLAVEKGGKDLKNFATVAGMSTKEFKRAFKEDATSAIMQFIDGLSKSGERGKSAIKVLDDMGITETRLRDALLRSANASEVMAKAVKLGNDAWEDNTALTNEANKRYETVSSQIKIAINKIKDLAVTFGNKMLPTIKQGIKYIENLTEKVGKLDDNQIQWILNIGKAVVVIGPLLTIVGKVTSTAGTAIKTIGTFTQAIGVARGTITSTSTAVNMLAKVMTGLTSPVGLACITIGAAITGIAIAINKANEEVKKSFETMGKSASDFVNGIDNANSHLNSFNSTLFASEEEQQALKQNMDEIQKGITEICKTATEERRDYTQEEIEQLDEYFTKLKELKDRELEIQQNIGKAITQQAEQNAQSFQGNLSEYKVQSQEWIKTAQEQAQREIGIINDRTTQEIALLQQRYGERATLEDEEYAREYNKIIENKDKSIQEANDEVAKVNSIYSNGYFERMKQDDNFYNALQEYNSKVEAENSAHSKKLEEIENNKMLIKMDKQLAIEGADRNHRENLAKIYKEMSNDMSEEQIEQLGVLTAMSAQTEQYGGKIDDETRKTVNSIIASYDSMPNKTREAMKNAMSPMLDEMEKKEPSLFAKATGIANGILSRLRKAFDEHSPSKKTRKIMKFAMSPMEEEMETGKKELFKQADEIGNGITSRLSNLNSNVNIKENEVIGGRNSTNNNINYDNIAQIIGLAINDSSEKIISLLIQILEKKNNTRVVLDTGVLVGETKDAFDTELANNQTRRKRGN